MDMENLDKRIGEIFDTNNRYIIPLYQRNYAWGKEQIEALIQDIYEAYKLDSKKHYYIGSLVVLKRRNGDYEVIDGQQRLTTLSLLTRLLGIGKAPVLSYESRPEVELFFKEFYAMRVEELNTANELKLTPSPQTYYLRQAIEIIKNTRIKVSENSTDGVGFETWKEEIRGYLKDNVIIVRVEIPEDTDVASYFEIMNNRGEQLQKHEILKARLMNVLEEKYHTEFDLIWTACSNIDTPIQQCFDSKLRAKYFGNDYNTFTFTGLTGEILAEASDNSQQPSSINAIIDDAKGKEIENAKKGVNTERDSNKISSIIDFPNFLMHVLKLYAKNKPLVQLNEKFLLSCATELFGTKPNDDTVKEFIALLFKCRTLFDRYVIKAEGNENEEGFNWVLYKPEKYDDSTKYEKNTFQNNMLQNHVIKAQSMLQVTFRQRIYKNWLQKLLDDLNNKTCELHEIKADEILESLHKYMKDHLKDLEEFKAIEDGSLLCKGLNTPHFLLNFIDYLYWVKQEVHRQEVLKEEPSFKIEDFKFRYWNSVEHHLAQKKAAENQNLADVVDCLGNLFMISKNANSRLSDRDVKEKVEMTKEDKMGANRQIIYKKTKKNNNTYSWDNNDIIDHYEELKELVLEEREKLINS